MSLYYTREEPDGLNGSDDEMGRLPVTFQLRNTAGGAH
jgi:hypothetical protein